MAVGACPEVVTVAIEGRERVVEPSVATPPPSDPTQQWIYQYWNVCYCVVFIGVGSTLGGGSAPNNATLRDFFLRAANWPRGIYPM